jgi:hypothetical protein
MASQRQVSLYTDESILCRRNEEAGHGNENAVRSLGGKVKTFAILCPAAGKMKLKGRKANPELYTKQSVQQCTPSTALIECTVEFKVYRYTLKSCQLFVHLLFIRRKCWNPNCIVQFQYNCYFRNQYGKVA